jgi:N-acetylmuramoyl-L-alanine amidase
MGPPCDPRRLPLFSVLAALGLGLGLACGKPETPEVGASVAIEPTALPSLEDAEAFAMPLERLRAIEDAWTARAGPSPEGVRAARRAAALARIRALRASAGAGEGTTTGEAEAALDRARSLLREASLRRNVAGACEAALDLARLEARDAADPAAAYVLAYRTARRFGAPSDVACATEARRILGVLEGYRADRALLAAINADIDTDDPSVGLVGDPVSGAAEPADPAALLARWAEQRTSVGGDPAILQAITIYGAHDPRAQGVRTVLALDRVTTFERLDLPAEGAFPRRLAIDLARTTPGEGIDSAIPVGTGGVVRIRHARHDGGTRVVLDLEPTAEARLFLLPEPFRVVIDVRRHGPATSPSVTAGRAREVDLVMLDPGHGGNDYGARAHGLEEADVVLDLALRVREALRTRLPAVRVVLTRERDTFVSLEQRAAMANAVDADAFVSIHLNASEEPVEHGGITTFVLDTTSDRQALRLAARENGTSVSEVGALQRILAGLRRQEQVAASRALAERIHRGALAGGRTLLPHLHDRGVRSAMFYVLVGATMPAVLIEASFLTRAEEARALRSESYRQALADGIAEGIARWVEGR